MKILFITSNRIGDAVLSTGILDHLIRTHPGSEITVACGPLAVGFFTATPGVRKLIPLVKKSRSLHWLDLWKECVSTKWDIVVDLRNSAVSRLIFSKKKFIWNGGDPEKHKVEQLGDLLKLDTPPAPTLWFDNETLKQAAQLVSDGAPVLAIAPSANWPGKTWPAENFIELNKRLLDGPFSGWRVVVIAAPGEERQALPVLAALPPDKRIDMIAKASPALAAAAIGRCSFFIGNDSGLMHCAAATKIPTLGLFGPSWPHLYRPWGKHCAFVSTAKNYTELTDFPGYDPRTTGSLMQSLSVDAVFKAVEKLLVQV